MPCKWNTYQIYAWNLVEELLLAIPLWLLTLLSVGMVRIWGKRGVDAERWLETSAIMRELNTGAHLLCEMLQAATAIRKAKKLSNLVCNIDSMIK